MNAENDEIISCISLDMLQPFPGHPFKVKNDAEMDDLVNSIAQSGIIVPAIVRPLESGRYELISGHRRLAACRKLGIEKLPVVIECMNDEDAIISMVDSNIHREHILPSEKAFAYKMKMEAIKMRNSKIHVGVQLGPQEGSTFKGKRSAEILGEEAGESASQVKRYIRLTNLIPELLEYLDSEKIAFSVGVELSFLSEQQQRILLEAIQMSDATPSYSQSCRMHKLALEGCLDDQTINQILKEKKPNQLESIRLPVDEVRKYLPSNMSQSEMQDFILKACRHYQKFLYKQKDYER